MKSSGLFFLLYIYIYNNRLSGFGVNGSLTKPEFARHVTESFFVAGPVAVEVDGAVLSSLEHLHVTTTYEHVYVTMITYMKCSPHPPCQLPSKDLHANPNAEPRLVISYGPRVDIS